MTALAALTSPFALLALLAAPLIAPTDPGRRRRRDRS